MTEFKCIFVLNFSVLPVLSNVRVRLRITGEVLGGAWDVLLEDRADIVLAPVVIH